MNCHAIPQTYTLLHVAVAVCEPHEPATENPWSTCHCVPTGSVIVRSTGCLDCTWWKI